MGRLNSSELEHFVHLGKRKYRRERRALKKLFRTNEHRVEPDVKVVDRTIFKYWKNRLTLFSRMRNRDIYMTRELWFSVTPESVAKFVARFIKSCLPEAKVVLDVYCGGGGNTIQLAQYFPKVYGVDNSLDHLYCAYRNAQAYGVEDRVWLKFGDWRVLSRKRRFEKVAVDCVFSSPPWGGPEYLRSEVYDLEAALQPQGLRETLAGLLRISENVVLFLPRNADLSQLSRVTRELLGEQALCKVLYVKQNGYMKGILCFWGARFYNYAGSTAEPSGAAQESSGVAEPCEVAPGADTLDYSVDG
ncbi:RNA methyltransferase [Lachancea thermotolerans CBS 6340]|uniref:Trimethylguanosine synthase n=1 Tax=Lachancea thermotolerans (strain ATCC 56472 / CBS 6340 / NRRL Y-8284) TaxID=559295 RepID=C5DF09_LACTC|nr:KLTH0D11330p [Lachancea thermotolerans CBS 6340]CAR22764.1 KLTH0D11330p [Lachancea thermotolerans CBS 6340]